MAFVFFKTYVIDETLQRVQFSIGVLGLQASSRRQPKAQKRNILRTRLQKSPKPKITKPEIPKASVQIFFQNEVLKIMVIPLNIC